MTGIGRTGMQVGMPSHAGDGGDGGDAVGHLAADAVGEEAAVGHAGDVDAVRVDAQLRLGVVEEVFDEADVVDVVA